MGSAFESKSSKKLTLRMEEAVIARAKRYASEHGTSLSKLIADFFRALTSETRGSKSARDQSWKEDLPPTTRSLVGLAGGGKADEDDYWRYASGKHD